MYFLIPGSLLISSRGPLRGATHRLSLHSHSRMMIIGPSHGVHPLPLPTAHCLFLPRPLPTTPHPVLILITSSSSCFFYFLAMLISSTLSAIHHFSPTPTIHPSDSIKYFSPPPPTRPHHQMYVLPPPYQVNLVSHVRQLAPQTASSPLSTRLHH